MTAVSVNVSEFSRAVSEFAESLPQEQLVPFQQKLALQVVRGVVFKTRVDTGRARGGWQADINRDPSGATGLDPSGGAAVAACTNAILALKPFQAIVVANNVSYIVYLEERYGMVALTVQEIATQFS